VSTERGRRSPRIVVAVVAAAALVVVAVAVVFLIGVRDVPDYPSIAEQTQPPLDGRLAIQRGVEQPRTTCVDIMEAATGAISVSCLPIEDAMWLGWDADGHLLVASFDSAGPVLRTIDVDSGKTLKEEALPKETQPPDNSKRADGSRVFTEWHEDGRAEVWVDPPDAAASLLFSARGPDGYSFWSASWSPQGDHVLVSDSEQRVIIIAAEGDASPRTIDDTQQVAWYQPA